MKRIAMIGTVLILVPAAFAAEPAPRGLVDGSAFSEFADLGAEVVEIHVPGALLAAVSRGMRESPEAADVLARLDAIEAVIVGFGEAPDAGIVERARDLVTKTERRLAREGWERVVRVRETGSSLNVFILEGGDKVDGLVVVGFDSGQNEMIFANIAGRIDLAQIGALGDSFDIPGLEGIAPPKRGER